MFIECECMGVEVFFYFDVEGSDCASYVKIMAF